MDILPVILVFLVGSGVPTSLMIKVLVENERQTVKIRELKDEQKQLFAEIDHLKEIICALKSQKNC